jgi:hypothetical protein
MRAHAAHDGRLAAKWDHYHRIYDRHLSQLRGIKWTPNLGPVD